MSNLEPVTAYFAGTSAWFAIQAIPLLLSPRLIVTMIEPSIREASDLEAYLLRALSFAFLALSVYTLLLSGFFPLPEAAFSEKPGSSATATTIDNPVIAISPSTQNPLRMPTLVVTTVYHLVMAFGCYTRLLNTGQYTFLFGILGGATLGMFGFWCTLFGDDSPGAKNRSSGWMFPTAAKRGMKMEKREAREEKWSKLKKGL